MLSAQQSPMKRQVDVRKVITLTGVDGIVRTKFLSAYLVLKGKFHRIKWVLETCESVETLQTMVVEWKRNGKGQVPVAYVFG